MLSLIKEKVLITTTNWFYAPDGKQYRGIWGTLLSVDEAGKTLGFIPNRAHANWFLTVGDLTIMGCQVMYVMKCPDQPNLGDVEDYTASAEHGIKKTERPSAIYKTT